MLMTDCKICSEYWGFVLVAKNALGKAMTSGTEVVGFFAFQ